MENETKPKIDPKERRLRELFIDWAGCTVESMEQLPQSGSNRRYFRIGAGGRTAIGAIGENDRETNAFLSFSRSLGQAGLRVPQVYFADVQMGVYLQQDLGQTSLYDFLLAERKQSNEGNAFTPELKVVYKKVLTALAELQSKGRTAVNFNDCYPRAAFDEQSMRWDLQYFKYYFLKLAGISFDEELLERDFDIFIKYLLETNCKFFLYRDMQSRNIMLDADHNPWFIDYQGGRRGARQYDVASLLYDAKADIPPAVRNELLAFYVSRLPQREQGTFTRHFYGYCLIRIMQAMGAYGYRGYFERKQHFLKSIPFALDNLAEILRQHVPDFNLDIPELTRVWKELAESKTLREISAGRKKLKVRVFSFSYKHGIPVDVSGNGGGYVFDCRCLPNPGREERYRQSTGRDADVLEFFARHADEMKAYTDSVCALLKMHIDNYRSRGFDSLMASFGCTGGQHRSVFCAETAARFIRENYPDVELEVNHIESINHREPRK